MEKANISNHIKFKLRLASHLTFKTQPDFFLTVSYFKLPAMKLYCENELKEHHIFTELNILFLFRHNLHVHNGKANTVHEPQQSSFMNLTSPIREY